MELLHAISAGVGSILTLFFRDGLPAILRLFKAHVRAKQSEQEFLFGEHRALYETLQAEIKEIKDTNRLVLVPPVLVPPVLSEQAFLFGEHRALYETLQAEIREIKEAHHECRKENAEMRVRVDELERRLTQVRDQQARANL